MFNFLFNIVTAVVVAAATVVAAIAIAPAAGIAVIGTYAGAAVLCLANAFNICPPSGSNGGNTTSGTPTITTPTQNTNSNTSGNSNSNGGNGGTQAPQICTSAPNAVCGITNQGTIVNGVCNATTPLNSSCPAPVIDATRGFYPDPNFVRSGDTTSLHWNATNATGCTIIGGGLNLANLGILGSTITGVINQKTVFTLTCTNGTGGPSTSVNTTVNLTPEYKNN